MMGFRNSEIKNLAKELKVLDSLAFEWMPFVPPILLSLEGSRVAFKQPSGYVIRLPSTV